VFFRANAPATLGAWYEQHLGINQVPTTYDAPAWQQASGTTVFASFHQNTDYFGRETQLWMLNFRVNDLAAMVAQLQKGGYYSQRRSRNLPQWPVCQIT
jgi:glyoxylase I family protein